MPSSTTVKPFDISQEIHPPVTYGAVQENIPYERYYGSFKACPKLLRQDDILQQTQIWIAKFNDLVNSNFQDWDPIIMPHASWKDHLALSWEHHQWHYAENIAKQLNARQPISQLSNFQIDKEADLRSPLGVRLETVHDGDTPIEHLLVYVVFETKFGYGKGIFRLVAVDNCLKLLTIYTTLEELANHPESIGYNRPEGVNHGQNIGRKIWLEERAKDFEYGRDKQPVVLIVGGGQSGLATAARLKMLGIDSLIIEKNPKLGDNWRNRYSFLVLHDPVWADHLPYLPFPENWPVYTPKDKLGDWFQFYADSMELSYWTNKYVNGAKFDANSKTWEIQIFDNTTNSLATVLKPKHLVMATGHSGEPNIPHFKNEEIFKGKLHHSSKHTTGLEYNGENTVVVGSCNSAHDIAQDFYEQGANVTMIQRSSTCVINVDKGANLNNQGVFSQDGPKTETADRISQSMPVPFVNLMQQQKFRQTVELEKEMILKLTAKGFKLDSGYAHTGLQGKYYRRGGGYYIDVGGSSLIVEDKIHLKQGVEIKSFSENGLELTDGSQIDNVKVVVLATGYLNMKSTARRIFGDEVAQNLKNAWGLNDEGELEGIFTDSGHENFWYAGGNLALVRYFSKKLALRILAQELQLI